ncbi:uncharacterized protein [Zea mays]|uniref:Uncharacterized protein n=1 Tax=Zea mays TaxID=4577 RepID=A0A804P6C1_MAIZE|nr:uncharacterized protein LOC103625734 isoform X2 [Zea mays]|eukprot:XP_008644357.1 uncharacterized protein LOC103625734 isoform X2 [Zea mays]
MYFSIWRLEREQQRETDVEENHRSNWLGLRLGIWQTGCVSTKIQNSLDQKLQLPIVVKGLVLRTLDKVSCCYKGSCRAFSTIAIVEGVNQIVDVETILSTFGSKL